MDPAEIARRSEIVETEMARVEEELEDGLVLNEETMDEPFLIEGQEEPLDENDRSPERYPDDTKSRVT